MRQLRTAVMALVMLMAVAGSAIGGGSSIEPYRESYLPGETVMMRGDVSPGQLGWVEDGPFYAYLRVDPNAGAGANRFPHIDESDIYLGELELSELSSGWVHVSISFNLPQHLPHGTYHVVYCNEPCTQGLGDLIGGWVMVRTPRPAPPPGMAPIPVGVYLL